jgi:NAD(P)-dependent dehydrogenase (short-subunit alcohol dehydrogenase family)
MPVPTAHMPESPLPGSSMLEGKVALVSGIGPGMGRDIALLLARHGADVVLGARRSETSDQVAAEIRDVGRRAEVVTLDITDAGACEAAVERATRALGGLDVLVNNAFQDGNHKGFLDAPILLARSIAPYTDLINRS